MNELLIARSSAFRDMERIIEAAKSAGANELTRSQDNDYRNAEQRLKLATVAIDGKINDINPDLADPFTRHAHWAEQMTQRAETPALVAGPERVSKKQPDVVLRKDQSLRDWAREKGLVTPESDGMSAGKFLRGVLTGDWTDAELEKRALSEGTNSAGGFTVPVPLASDLIDKARAATRVFQAGALTVPMEHEKLQIARLATDPSAAWKSENAAIAESDPTFEQVQFQARTLVALVRASRELIEDSLNIEEALERAFVGALSVKLDKAALYGSGTAPEPKGVKNITGVNKVSMGPTGAALTNYDPFVDAIYEVQADNHQPTGVILSPRTEKSIAKLKATDNQPLQAPDTVKALPRFPTTQVPIDLTVGTSTDCSDIHIADFSQLMFGVRSELRIQLLQERYAENLQLGFIAYLRADVQVTHPEAFCIVEGVRP